MSIAGRTFVKPIAVQLYSLRDESAEDFDGVLARMAAIGYKGVEPFNFFGKSPSDFKAQIEDLGMAVSSSHTPWANRAELGEVVETTQALGLHRAPAGFGPADFADMDAVKRTAETINALVEGLAPHGIELFLHNHWWEFQEIGGKLGMRHIAERCPQVLFEVDTYWAANFGKVDAAAEVAHLKARTPLLHIKDGPLERDRAHVAVGDGKVDVAGHIEAADPDVLEWVIVEIDSCDTDMTTAVEKSYRYLTANGLAVGNV